MRRIFIKDQWYSPLRKIENICIYGIYLHTGVYVKIYLNDVSYRWERKVKIFVIVVN